MLIGKCRKATNMRSTPFCLGALVFLSLTVLPFQLEAQEAGQAPIREPVPHTNLISAGPLMLLAGWFNAEFETKLSETFTTGAVAGWLEMDRTDYAGINAFIRYYHQGAAFTGFYVGGRGGVYNVEHGGDSETTLGLGLDLGYGWLLGPSDAFFIGLGVGATGLLGLDLDGAKSVIPAVRLLDIGVAF